MSFSEIVYLLPQSANIYLICGDFLKTYLCSDLTQGLIPDPTLVNIMCHHQVSKIHPLDEMNIIVVID